MSTLKMIDSRPRCYSNSKSFVIYRPTLDAQFWQKFFFLISVSANELLKCITHWWTGQWPSPNAFRSHAQLDLLGGRLCSTDLRHVLTRNHHYYTPFCKGRQSLCETTNCNNSFDITNDVVLYCHIFHKTLPFCSCEGKTLPLTLSAVF